MNSTSDIVDALKGTFLASLSTLFRPVNHAETVLQVPPVWVRASGAEALFGVRREWLNNQVAHYKIIAKKADGIVLYKYADILKVIDEMPDYKKGA